MAPAGQFGVVIRVLRCDELQTGVSHKMPTFTADIFWNGGNTISVCFFYLFRLSPFLDAPWKRGSCARNRTMQQIFQNKIVSILTMVTWQRDALLVARFPLTVLVHSAALAAGLLVAHV